MKSWGGYKKAEDCFIPGLSAQRGYHDNMATTKRCEKQSKSKREELIQESKISLAEGGKAECQQMVSFIIVCVYIL